MKDSFTIPSKTFGPNATLPAKLPMRGSRSAPGTAKGARAQTRQRMDGYAPEISVGACVFVAVAGQDSTVSEELDARTHGLSSAAAVQVSPGSRLGQELSVTKGISGHPKHRASVVVVTVVVVALVVVLLLRVLVLLVKLVVEVLLVVEREVDVVLDCVRVVVDVDDTEVVVEEVVVEVVKVVVVVVVVLLVVVDEEVVVVVEDVEVVVVSSCFTQIVAFVAYVTLGPQTTPPPMPSGWCPMPKPTMTASPSPIKPPRRTESPDELFCARFTPTYASRPPSITLVQIAISAEPVYQP